MNNIPDDISISEVIPEVIPEVISIPEVIPEVISEAISIPEVIPEAISIPIPTLSNWDEQWQQSLDWLPNPEQSILFQRLFTEISLGNRQLNLTRITEPDAFWEKHLWDSLSLVLIAKKILDFSQPLRVIDIGTGGGFPGLPIAIAFPHWSLTLLDSTQKKIKFLHNLANNLQLNNIHPLIGRSEAIAQDPPYREKFDLALLRAVADPSVCAEYALPFLKLGGIALLYRGHWQAEECDRLLAALPQVGGELLEVKPLQTPLTASTRHGIYLKKVAPTPAQYPRAIGIPSQYPL